MRPPLFIFEAEIKAPPSPPLRGAFETNVFNLQFHGDVQKRSFTRALPAEERRTNDDGAIPEGGGGQEKSAPRWLALAD